MPQTLTSPPARRRPNARPQAPSKTLNPAAPERPRAGAIKFVREFEEDEDFWDYFAWG